MNLASRQPVADCTESLSGPATSTPQPKDGMGRVLATLAVRSIAILVWVPFYLVVVLVGLLLLPLAWLDRVRQGQNRA